MSDSGLPGLVLSHPHRISSSLSARFLELLPSIFVLYPHMPCYCLLFVCLFFVILCVSTVTNFSAKDKISAVMVVHWRPGQGISYFGELCSPRSPKSDESVASPVLGSHGAGDTGVCTGHA